LDLILRRVAELNQQVPEWLVVERDRLVSRLADLADTVDPQRVEQEMAILIQKSDVAEELQRLGSHCEAMMQALKQSGPIGRRLDFLSQELHREANTLASKALNIDLTQASVDIKVWIEQIREQVQNIE